MTELNKLKKISLSVNSKSVKKAIKKKLKQ